MSRNLLTILLCSLVLGCTSTNPDQLTDVDQGSMSGTDQGGGDTDGGVTPDLFTPAPDGGISVAAACQDLAAAVCTRLAACSQYLLRYYYGDEKTCRARVVLTCAPYVNLTGSSWTVDRLRQCTAGYSAATCDEYFAPGGPPACQPQPGTLSDGTVCANSNQCKSAFCNIDQSSCGRCVTPAKSGDACSATKPCATGLTCTNAKCLSDGGMGAACGTGQAPCKSGFYCKTGACAAVLAAGATCDPTTATSGCDGRQGLYCGFTSRKCEAYKLADAGAQCGTVMGATVVCAAAGTCSGIGTRTCQPAAKDGDKCSPIAGGQSCMTPATCNQGACQVFDPGSCK